MKPEVIEKWVMDFTPNGKGITAFAEYIADKTEQYLISHLPEGMELVEIAKETVCHSCPYECNKQEMDICPDVQKLSKALSPLLISAQKAREAERERITKNVLDTLERFPNDIPYFVARDIRKALKGDK